MDALNDAWGTTFWSQRYGGLEEVQPPRATPAQANPGQLLDFARFSSDELLACYTAERDVLRELSPVVPVTTNVMVPFVEEVDLHRWAGEVNVIANDHYLQGADPQVHAELALGGDVCRGLSGGAPWVIMEHSTSAVNWQARNIAKRPGELRRNSLRHLARGADGILFFQWRASLAGAERWHSAMLPHAGTDSKIWREVVQLGADLRALAEVEGSRVHADVALLCDWECGWATAHGSLRSQDKTFLDAVRRWYTALGQRGVTIDAVHPSADLSEGETVRLAGGGTASAWSELVHPEGAQVVDAFSDGRCPAGPRSPVTSTARAWAGTSRRGPTRRRSPRCSGGSATRPAPGRSPRCRRASRWSGAAGTCSC